MEIDLAQLLSSNVILLLFTVMGLGYLIGNIKVGSIQVGSTTGVLLAGLLFGHLGFPDLPDAATFGFAIFIFSVGLQAGPSFFSVFLQDGSRYVALSLVVAATAVALAVIFSGLIGLETGLNAGLLAGALTSTPTLAGAKDAVTSGLAVLPEGMTANQASTNITIGYAITYIFGTAGLIVFIRYFPLIFRVDLVAEAHQFAEERGLVAQKRRGARTAETLPLIRAYRIADDEVGRPLGERRRELGRRFQALKIRRGNEFIEPKEDTVLQAGDVISIVGGMVDHEIAQERLGKEILDPELLNYQIVSREIVVITPYATGKPLADVDVTGEYGCFVTGLTRNGIDLPVNENLVLGKGDRLEVIGEESRLQQLAERIGHIEEAAEETDLLTFAFGIAAGIVLGTIVVKVGNLSIGLGSAGGLLLAGILIGFLRNIHPTFGRVPAAARFMLMELGLMFFMASVGLKAGSGILEALTSVGPVMIICGALVTISPVLVGYAFGRYVLKLNPALLLGSITGAMTSTPSLNIVTTAAKSHVPALGYAGTYTFANVLLTFAGTLIMIL